MTPWQKIQFHNTTKQKRKKKKVGRSKVTSEEKQDTRNLKMNNKKKWSTQQFSLQKLCSSALVVGFGCAFIATGETIAMDIFTLY